MLKRADDLKAYILKAYKNLPSDKLDVVKIGARIYIILVTRDNKLAREKVYRGSLESIEGVTVLQNRLDETIKKIMIKHKYV